MYLSVQQQAARRNLSYILAEKPSQYILSGEFTAGDIPLGEVELGEQFVVSCTAVCEAVKILVAKGMILPHPRIETRVLPCHQWYFLDQEPLG